MHILQEMFEKYGRAAHLEALPVRSARTLLPDPSEDM
jgi:hypothetical protein